MARISLPQRPILATTLLIVLSTLSPPSRATDVCGDTTGPSEQWTVAGSPYVVTCDVRVPPTFVLTVDAGVEVRFQAGTRLEVEGSLDVNGVSGNEVSFTSDAVSPAVADWVGLRLESSSTGNVIEHATVAYASNAIFINAAPAVLDHVETTYSIRGVYVFGDSTVDINALTSRFNTDGLYFIESNSTVTVTASTLTDNDRYGVFLDGDFSTTAPNLIITGSSIHSNLGSFDFYTLNYATPTQHSILARGNWWGTVDEATIDSRIRDYRAHTASPLVDWCDWLDGAGGVPIRDVECPDLAICGETVDWTITARPYLLTSDVQICSTGLLNVAPGVRVRAIVTSPTLDFVNLGTLSINGTPGNEIRFGSDAVSPVAGSWSGLSLQAGSGNTIEYAAFVDAVNAVLINATSATLDHVETTNSTRGVYVYGDSTVDINALTSRFNNDGLYFAESNSTVTVTASTLTDNARYGVYLNGDFSSTAPDLIISGSSIHSNLGAYDFYTQDYSAPTQRVIVARGNWWGDIDGTAISSRIRDYRVYTASPLVDWCGWLDGAGGVPARDVECPDLAICGETVDWTVTARPYLLTSDLQICSTGSLNVAPGVEVRAVVTSPTLDFINQGTLSINGTPGNEVRFGSDAVSPVAASWSGLSLQAGSGNTIEHAAVADAGNAVLVHTTSATLDHVETTNSTRGVYVYRQSTVDINALTSRFNNDGLYFADSNSTVTVTASTLTDNARYGVYLNGDFSSTAPNLIISGSSIHSNLGAYDFYTQNYSAPAQRVILAQGNWWGDTDGTAISSRIHDYRAHTASPLVDSCDWLDGAGGVPARDVECPDLAICGETVDWTVTARPYLLTSDVQICSTGSLDVAPGVEVRAVVTSPTLDFFNQGTLSINGTPGSEVRFGSDAASPVAGSWSGLSLRAGSGNTIEHAAVADAGNAVLVHTTSATLDHVETTNSTRGVYVYRQSTVDINALTSRFNNDGLYFADSNSTVTVTASTLTDNSRYGVYLNGDFSSTAPNLIITASSIHSNLGGYDYYTYNYANPSTTTLWAPDNWWGTVSAPLIAGRIRDHDDITSSPRVNFQPFGALCARALGGDLDGDGLGDFEDNCPDRRNADQTDTDGDLMGDACDPQPGVTPAGTCDGISDAAEGYADADVDGWGDPCDFQPTRDDCYPGALEICDGRDNDGDGQFLPDELDDADLDDGLTCADCDEVDPLVNTCTCEDCDNLLDDDCDLQTDGADSDCEESPLCVLLGPGASNPDLDVHKNACGGASPSGPFDVVSGSVAGLQIGSGHVDLGAVDCVAGGLIWDRVTELARNVNPACNDPLTFYLARNTSAADFGNSSTGEPRDVMTPDPPCP